MKVFKNFFLFFLFITFVSLSMLYSGNTGKIAGRAIDKSTGEALPFANILVVGTTMGTVTDINGDYFIINIPPGLYNLQARMMGYHNANVKNVKVKIDQTSVVNFELSMEVIEMPETVVYGRKIIEPDVTTSKVELSGQEIARMAVADPIEALLTSTSIVRDPGRREVHVRGGRGGEVLYLIDGMEVRDPLVGSNISIKVDDSEVNEMVMLLGGFNAEYGNAQSGIVNIVTKEGDISGHSVELSYKNDHTLLKQESDFWNRKKNSFNADKVTFSAGGPEIITKQILPALGLKIPWSITYYVSSTGDWSDTYTPYPDTGRSFLNTYLLWDKIRLKDRQDNGYTANSKLACKFSPTAKLTFGYRQSWQREFRYAHRFRYIPETAYYRDRGSYQVVTDWNQTLADGRTFYTLAMSYFHTQYELSPGGRKPNEINNFPTSSDNPIDIVIGRPGIDGINEPYVDLSRYNGVYNWGEIFDDLNKNGYWDEGEPFTDMHNFNGHYDIGEVFRDYNGDGLWTGKEPFDDYGIDGIPGNKDFGEGDLVYELGEPFQDYNGNGVRDCPVGDQFYDYGFDQWAQWHKRYTNCISFKGDITSQITKAHLLKSGIEYKKYEMDHKEIQYPWYTEERDPLPPGPWPDRGIFRDCYQRHPSSGAYYVQDKIETEGMIVNFGIRFDFVYPGPEVKEVREEEFSLFGTEITFSPRFGISFPISEFDKMYFSYGHFSQAPEFQYFYQDTTQYSSAVRLYGNPNLNCQSTVSYQLGVVHAFGNLRKVEVRGFYKDIRGLIDTEERGYAPFTYQMRVNKDYGSVRGIEIDYDKRLSQFYAFSFAYTLQWASGKSSSERQGYDYTFNGIPLPLREYPLNWDQRHSITNIIDFRALNGKHPVLFGLTLPDKWGVNILTQLATGLPYTPTTASGGEDVQGLPNSARQPYTVTTDLKAEKSFYIGPLKYKFTLEVKNVFDRSNILEVYTSTGKAHYSDPLDPSGSEYERDPTNWSPRRQFYFGVALGV